MVQSLRNEMSAIANAEKITPGPTRLMLPRPHFAPRNRLNRNPDSGNSSIRPKTGNDVVISVSASPLHQAEFVGVDGFATAENRNDDRQSDRSFGSGNRHDEKH